MRAEIAALIGGAIGVAVGFYFGYDYGHRKGAAVAVDLANDYIKEYNVRNETEKEELKQQLKLLTPDTNKTVYTVNETNSFIQNEAPEEHVNVFKKTTDKMVQSSRNLDPEEVDEYLMEVAWGDQFVDGRTESFGVPKACSNPDFYNEVKLGPDDYPEWITAESKWSQDEIDARAYPPPYLYDPESISAWVMGDMAELPDVPSGIVHTAKSYDMYLDRVDFVNPEFSEEVILTNRGAEPDDIDEEAYDVNDVWGIIGPDSGIKMAYLCQELRVRDGFQIGLINEAMGLAIECHVYAMGGTDFEKGASD